MCGKHEKKGAKEFFKKNYVILFLVVFVLFGGYLRFYHVDYPSIGYHNMKENEYIDQVKAYYNGEVPLVHRYRSLSAHFEGPGYFEEYTQLPLLGWLGAFLWHIFGPSLAVLRIIIILFSLSSIVALYLLVKELSKNEYLALLSAFILSFLPLAVFFGRNIQPDTPAFACGLFFSYFMLKAMKTFETKHFLIAGLFIGFAALFKISFLIFLFPFIFLFPYNQFFDKSHIKQNIKKAALFMIGPAIFVFWSVFEKLFIFAGVGKEQSAFVLRLHPFSVFTSEYWTTSLPSMSNYLKDNFTWGLLLIFLFGLVFFILKYRLLLSKYVLLMALAIIPYSMLLSTYINAHNYYQIPFMHLVAIGIAYFVFNLGILLKRLIRLKYISYAPLLLLLIFIPSIQASTAAQFNTVFFGLDVGGAYLSQNMAPEERFVVLGHAQTAGVCTYSGHRCRITSDSSLEKLLFFEENRSVSWLFIYDQYGMYILQKNPEFLEYVSNNYVLRQAGFIASGQNLQLKYIILEKGGTLDLNITAEGVHLVRKYELTDFEVPFYVKNFE